MWRSERQKAWGNSPEGIKKLGKKVVAEFNRLSAGKVLPERIIKAPKPPVLGDSSKK
jgi:hypothetical protein